MLHLKDDVYIVEGIAKDCIYDLNTGNLYHIDKEATEIIRRVCFDNDKCISETEAKTIDELIDNSLIEDMDIEKPNYKEKSITSLKQSVSISKAWIEVCTNCNLHCLHCYNNSSLDCSTQMDFTEFQSVCSSLMEYGIKKVQIIGGEPFCNKNINQMLSFAASTFPWVEIFTNATLLTDEAVDIIRERKIRVAISLYSNIAEEHDKVTNVVGSYDRTVKNIEILRKNGIKFRISTILMDGINSGCLDNRCFDHHKCSVIKMSGRGNKKLLNYNLMRRKLIVPKSFSKKMNKDQISNRISGHNCFAQRIYIGADLQVYPCVMERRIKHGSLRVGNLNEILNPNIFSFNKDYIEECKDCEFRYACFDCRPDSLSGNIKEKPYYCTYDVKNGCWLGQDEFLFRFFEIKSSL